MAIGDRLRALLSGGRQNGAAVPETRSSASGFTDLVIAGLTARSAGDITTDAASTAAVEACSLIWSAAMAAADVKVKGSDMVRQAVTRRYLASVGRAWMRRGEAVHILSVSDSSGAVSLLPCASWDVNGGPDPRSWYYRADVFAPNSVNTVHVERAGVVHSQWAWHDETPWHGVAPWRRANLSAGLLAALERALAGEAGGPQGTLIPIPDVAGDDDPEDDDELSQLRTIVANLQGEAAMVPTTASGYGAGPGEAPARDMRGWRLGASPPQPLVALREQAEVSIVAASGVPTALVYGTTDGTLQREQWRRFVMGAVQAKADELAEVLSEALETRVGFSFKGLWAHDLAGRASAFKALLAGGEGLSVAEARAIAGLDDI